MKQYSVNALMEYMDFII